LLDIIGKGGEKQKVLSPGGQKGQDPANIPDKPHVQHAIGLIEDQYLDFRKIQGALLRVVEQPPGGGHQDIDASA
jgi:hypothetical protein